MRDAEVGCGRCISGTSFMVSPLTLIVATSSATYSQQAAEMALATLQNIEIPGVEPPYSLQLSHSPQIAPSVPSKPLFPQYVKSKILNHPIQLCTPQKLFQWFRHAGPLVYVRVGVDLGFAERTCIFEYWDDVHAAYAQTHCRSLHTSLRGMKPFFLRIIVPTNLTCSVRPIESVARLSTDTSPLPRIWELLSMRMIFEEGSRG